MAPVQPWVSGKGYWGDRFVSTTVVQQGGSSGGGTNTNTRTTFTGTIDGNNRIFTLPTAPNGSNLEVFYNGTLVSSPDDYTLSGVTVTFSRAPKPASPGFSADVIIAYYGGGSQRQLVSGTLDGINNIFTLPSAPSATSLQFFRDGSLQFEGIDYTLVGNQVTLLNSAPDRTVVLVAYF